MNGCGHPETPALNVPLLPCMTVWSEMPLMLGATSQRLETVNAMQLVAAPTVLVAIRQNVPLSLVCASEIVNVVVELPEFVEPSGWGPSVTLTLLNCQYTPGAGTPVTVPLIITVSPTLASWFVKPETPGTTS